MKTFLALSLLLGLVLSQEPLLFNVLSTDVVLGRKASKNNAPVFEAVVRSEGAAWIRLFFSSKTSAGMIKVTSLLDGATQHLTPLSLSQWQFSSAYFNGEAVLVEVSDMNDPDSFVEVVSFQAGLPTPADHDKKSICNPSDTRVLSSVRKSGRYLGSGGCTGWLINDKNHCFLTAHHCGMDSTGGGTMQFQVPLSEPTPLGHKIVHPPPKDQYSVDPKSLIRAQSPVGVGNDWQYFGCFPNSETGLTPFESQGESYTLVRNLTVPEEGRVTTINGYGVVENFESPKEWNQAQKFSQGTFSYDRKDGDKWPVYYRVDTTGGDSGSGVEVMDENGVPVAVAVHTHGGCGRLSPSSNNAGTFIGLDSLQKALANPQGVCA